MEVPRNERERSTLRMRSDTVLATFASDIKTKVSFQFTSACKEFISINLFTVSCHCAGSDVGATDRGVFKGEYGKPWHTLVQKNLHGVVEL